MVTRTYINKICTIVKDSPLNSGINPVAELHYGDGLYSRMLLQFDVDGIKKNIEDKTFANKEKLHHYLHLTNAGSIDFTELHCGRPSDISNGMVKRATSFDLIFFLVPMEWDGGKGFDMVRDKFTVKDDYLKFHNQLPNLVSEDGCNWFKPRNGYKWNEEGVYSNETLSVEYDNFASTNGSKIIFCRQHFDIGNENIHIDITDLVNKYINEEIPNYGIGIAFTPLLEETRDEYERYCSFFTHKTNSFFEPYVESVYEDYISDDRGTFTINKNNRLFLYCNIGNLTRNLDEIPRCMIDGREYDVKQFGKGIYYVEVFGDKSFFKARTMHYDTWFNLKYDGVDFDDVEMEFVVYPQQSFFNFGNSIKETTHLSSTLYGIKQDERINRGDIRKVGVIARKNYTSNKAVLSDEMYYRVYVMDGEREIDVIKWENVNRTVTENFFSIDTSMLIPQRYHIDIKYKYNMEEITEKKALSFIIVNNLSNKYN